MKRSITSRIPSTFKSTLMLTQATNRLRLRLARPFSLRRRIRSKVSEGRKLYINSWMLTFYLRFTASCLRFILGMPILAINSFSAFLDFTRNLTS